MSKGPDLSAFPIPRKGGARPLSVDEPTEAGAEDAAPGQGASTAAHSRPVSSPRPATPRSDSLDKAGNAQVKPQARPVPHAAAPVLSGQTVATTVKLDEDRYLRLADAGKPGPGRLKRRTIQEIMVEALDEWFAHRGL